MIVLLWKDLGEILEAVEQELGLPMMVLADLVAKDGQYANDPGAECILAGDTVSLKGLARGLLLTADIDEDDERFIEARVELAVRLRELIGEMDRQAACARAPLGGH